MSLGFESGAAGQRSLLNLELLPDFPGLKTVIRVESERQIWRANGQYREIDINESETNLLIGMQRLRGYDLRMRIIEGGTVVIEAFQ
jgi:hypothetical protein